MPGCTSIIAQTIEAKGNKKSFAAFMQVHYAGSRGQSSRSSTTFRTTRWPLPDTLGLGSFRLGSATVAGDDAVAFHPCPSTSMRTHMPGRTSIIAQTIETQGNKNFFAALMQVHCAGSRRQSSQSLTTFRTTRRPLPETLGLGSFRLGSAATVRLARRTGGLPLMACNQSSTRFTARLTWDWVYGV